jgi:L-2-hydroxyglutarate oxidase LhgO
MEHEVADFLVIGAGIIGLRVAMELKQRNPKRSVVILEKEKAVGLHASGRNSGVIHSGFYYTADSLKARLTREGNLSLREYIKHKGLPLNECGKLVVAKDEQELEVLQQLMQRGEANGVPLDLLTVEQARRIEPRVKTYRQAIYSPSTATTDPGELIRCVLEDALAMGIKLHYSSEVVEKTKHGVVSGKVEFETGYVVNAAGLYADKIAHLFGHGNGYCILPFKGVYLMSDEPAGSFQTNIYSVPDLTNPFLGVHITVTMDGRPKLGPTAISAFGREQYGRFKGIRCSELGEIISNTARLAFDPDSSFRSLAIDEMRKYNRKYLVHTARSLASGLREHNFRQWGRSGIRAQLYNKRTNKLVMDFYHEGDKQSFHVLNAVSPGWTCAIPFAKYLVDQIEAQ